MKIFEDIEKTIGNTPLVKLNNTLFLESDNTRLSVNIYAKLEFLNPFGSIKDRAALQMINAAEQAGKLDAGATIIEPTSGNTGIALAAIGNLRGYKTIIVMPDNMSKERIDTMEAYGAEVVLTPAGEGMVGSINKANEIAQRCASEDKIAFIPDQFSNPANAYAHYDTTAPEIWQALNGKIDVFVASIGTGGTITGVARYLKEQNPEIKIFGVEPASSPILSTFIHDNSLRDEACKMAGAHKIQGIGANFIPDLLDVELLDDVITVTDEEAYKYTKKLANEEAIFAGISSGANVCGALKAAKILRKTRAENIEPGKNEPLNIVTVLPDGGAKYMSCGVFE